MRRVMKFEKRERDKKEELCDRMGIIRGNCYESSHYKPCVDWYNELLSQGESSESEFRPQAIRDLVIRSNL